MKTPRELLLERHRAAGLKLDAVRREALKCLSREPGSAMPLSLTTALRQFFWPHPRAWAGLAVVWVLILFLHVAARDTSEVATKETLPPSPDVALALKQQRQLRAELIGQSAPLESDRPRPLLPRPRSDHREGRLSA